MPTLRLDKIIADSSLFSRKEASALIKSGRVAVGGRNALSGTEKYNPYEAQITVDGELLKYCKFRYIMLNKPRGYISSTEDKREITVMDILDKRYSKFGMFPVGRLDKDAEGLLLITNDGEFAHMITSPAKKVKKRYFVEIDGAISAVDIERFAQGITLNDGTKCMPAGLEPAPQGAFVTLYEGKYHQVKRMMAALGKPITSLKRVSIGNLVLDKNLKPGDYRELFDEINSVIGDLTNEDV